MGHLTKRNDAAKGITTDSEIQEAAPANQFIRLAKSPDGHLANHGGGDLLFGISDDEKPETPSTQEPMQVSRDSITGIIDRYLSPAFQCDVFDTCQTGNSDIYPVVRVPSHGSVPICSKNNGPHDLVRNKPQGIRKGLYYIRAPGPKSIAIETPEQWRDLIHRCVINERENLLKSIGKLFRQPEITAEPRTSQLRDWHGNTHEIYLGYLNNSSQLWPTSINQNHYQLSFQIVERGEKTKLTVSTLNEAIRLAGEAVKNVVWTGWSMFHQFSREDIAPRILLDDSTGEEVELVETNLYQSLLTETHLGDSQTV